MRFAECWFKRGERRVETLCRFHPPRFSSFIENKDTAKLHLSATQPDSVWVYLYSLLQPQVSAYKSRKAGQFFAHSHRLNHPLLMTQENLNAAIPKSWVHGTGSSRDRCANRTKCVNLSK